MLVLTEDEVVQLLPVHDAIDLVCEAFIAFSNGTIICPKRLPLPLQPAGAVLLSMPAYDGALHAGVKLVSVQPDNAQRGVPVVRASYQLFDAITGEALALMGATRLTAIRTGAAGGVAARLLALPDAATLALLGTGVQAATQLLAAIAVRPIRDVWIYSRNSLHIREFIATMTPQVRVRLHAPSSAEDAVQRAAIVIAATNSHTPLFDDSALQPGTHITAVGAFHASMQEIPDATVVRASIYVDADEAAWEESGELLGPLSRGLIGRGHTRGEIGALAAQQIEGRRSATEITMFKSVGLAAQDLVCAAAVYRRASEAGIGLRAVM